MYKQSQQSVGVVGLNLNVWILKLNYIHLWLSSYPVYILANVNYWKSCCSEYERSHSHCTAQRVITSLCHCSLTWCCGAAVWSSKLLFQFCSLQLVRPRVLHGNISEKLKHVTRNQTRHPWLKTHATQWLVDNGLWHPSPPVLVVELRSETNLLCLLNAVPSLWLSKANIYNIYIVALFTSNIATGSIFTYFCPYVINFDVVACLMSIVTVIWAEVKGSKMIS